MSDSANTVYRRVGATRFPIEDLATTENAFTDPVQEMMLSLFRAAIIDELGPQFDSASFATPLSGKSVVSDVWPGLLTPQVMKQRKALFPLLAVAPTGKPEWSERTLGATQCRRKWAVDYVLGPLEVGAAQRLEKIFHKIEVLLQMVIQQRGHGSYMSGALQWGDGIVQGLNSVWLAEAEYGQAKFSSDAGDTTYYALSALIETNEHEYDIATYAPLTGTGFTVGVGGSVDGVIPAEVVAKTEFTPPNS